MMKRLLIVMALCAFCVAAGCMGTGSVGGMHDTFDDSAIGRFMREIGPEEMDVLMKDPDDPDEPGLPVDHLLYLLDRCSIDKMIDVVKRCSARRTLDLMYAVRRLGCNRPVDGYPLGKYNIPVTNTCSGCALADFNYLDLVIRIINGVQDAAKLARIINRESLEAVNPSGYNAYMEKLAYLLVYMADAEKMIALINGAIDVRDVVYFLDMMDTDTAPPVSTADIISGNQFKSLNVIRNLFEKIHNAGKLHYLINGARRFPGVDDDPAQIVYLRDKLVPIISGGTDPVEVWILKLSEMINTVNRMERLRNLLCELEVGDIPSIVELWTYCDAPDSPAPHENSIGTMARIVDGVEDPSKLVRLMQAVSPGNMASLVNGVAAGSRNDDEGKPDPAVAGVKLSRIIDGVNDVDDLAFVVNSVSNFNAMADLVNALKTGSTAKMAQLLNNIDGANYWNPSAPETANGGGKLVNMIDNITNLSDVATLLDGILDAMKLSDFINQVTNSSLIVGLINAVIADPDASTTDMVGLMNAIDRAVDIPKMARLVTDLNGTNNALIAGLLAPYATDASKGVGYEFMAALISSVQGIEEAGRLGGLIGGLNASLLYRGNPVSAKEGLVRIMRAGVEYSGHAFPGLGALHLAVMINSAESADALADLLNGIGIELMAPMVGCGDRIPAFRVPCTACGMGW